MSGERRTVWLLTSGDGDDGNEWNVVGVFSTREAADAYRAAYEARHGAYCLNAPEEWDCDPSPPESHT